MRVPGELEAAKAAIKLAIDGIACGIENYSFDLLVGVIAEAALDASAKTRELFLTRQLLTKAWSDKPEMPE
jgi:hypothetical protein